jgi:hypothetical protein
MLRFFQRNTPAASPDADAGVTIDDLRREIAEHGIGRDFLTYLEQNYNLEEVADFLLQATPDVLADHSQWTGPIGNERAAKPAKASAEPSQSRSNGQSKQERHVRGTKETWGARMTAEFFLWLVAFALWMVNGVATVYTITSVCQTLFGSGPGLILGIAIGVPAHYGITRVELYLWTKWHAPEYLLALVGCSLFDIGSTMFSVVNFFKARMGDSLASMPANVLTWPKALFGPLVSWVWNMAMVDRKTPGFDPSQLPSLDLPEWWFGGLCLLAIAFGIAIVSERLLRRYFRGMMNTWRERYGTA